MSGTGRDIMGLYEQNGFLAIDTKVLFYTQRGYLGDLAQNFKTATIVRTVGQ